MELLNVGDCIYFIGNPKSDFDADHNDDLGVVENISNGYYTINWFEDDYGTLDHKMIERGEGRHYIIYRGKAALAIKLKYRKSN
jgi:hypothetical protein